MCQTGYIFYFILISMLETNETSVLSFITFLPNKLRSAAETSS